MLPHLSPNKTWSGGIGGTVAAMVACAILATCRPDKSLFSGALLGAFLAVAAQAGDAAESLLKRAAGAKDSGTLIPGHGGILDRIDSFLFAAPALFWLPWPWRRGVAFDRTIDRVRRPIRVALLGSTGSIGRQALDVFATAGPGAVPGRGAGRGPRRGHVPGAARRRGRVRRTGRPNGGRPATPQGTELLQWPGRALEEIATRDDVDLLVVATGGVVSLRPILAALRRGTPVATANKETLVAGGHLVMPLARALAADHAGTTATQPASLQPALLAAPHRFRALGHLAVPGRRITLGGSAADPHRVGRSVPDLARRAARHGHPGQALNHPNWSMGSKITIDSASLMNKGLEVIEARWLYDLPYERIDVLVHPESLIHSLVEFVDGSLKAQLGLPDMRIPIQYAVSYPRRVPGPAPASTCSSTQG